MAVPRYGWAYILRLKTVLQRGACSVLPYLDLAPVLKGKLTLEKKNIFRVQGFFWDWTHTAQFSGLSTSLVATSLP